MFVLPVTHNSARRLVSPSFGRAVERLLDDSVDRYLGGAANGSRTPALDVAETDTAYFASFDLPGLAREQIKVQIDGRRVRVETVEAPKAEPGPEAADGSAPAAPRLLYRERSTARYARSVSLPTEVDNAASQARYENGVLTLTLAKRVPTGAAQLRID